MPKLFNLNILFLILICCILDKFKQYMFYVLLLAETIHVATYV